MRKNLLLAIGLIFLFYGCASVEGPISKKHYSSAQNLIYLQEVLEHSRKQYVKEHPVLAPKVRQVILEGRLLEGMSKEEAKASWGDPDIVYRTVTNNIVNEQWVYKGNIDRLNLEKRSVYLTFKDNFLYNWQE